LAAPPSAAGSQRPVVSGKKRRTLFDPGPAVPSPPAKRAVTAADATGTQRIVGAVVEVARGARPDQLHSLRTGRNTVGRGACDVQVDDGRVSSQHGFLFIDADGARFLDVSSNGSTVDGAPVFGGAATVIHGSRITLGESTLVVLLLPHEVP